MTWRGFLVCALDGFQVAVPDTDENRAYFGSSGTADNSAPFPQARAVLATAAGTRGALGLESGPSADGEQTLTRRMVNTTRKSSRRAACSCPAGTSRASS